MSEINIQPKQPEVAMPNEPAREYSVSSTPPKSHFTQLQYMTWIKDKLPGRLSQPLTRNYPLVIGIILSAIVGFSAGWVASHSSSGSGLLTTGSLSSQKQIVTSESQLITNIAKTVGPSVVSVNVTSTSQNNGGNLFGFGFLQQPTQMSAAGTGIILTEQGLIITNRHVVPVGTTQVSVTLSDGTELNDVSVIGRTSANSSLDIAFLKINNTKGKRLTPAQLGDSTKVQVGDDVVAIGNALGQFQNTVTSGIISGYGRSVQAGGAGQSSENLDDLFQTDAAINEGNSGGPLVNLNGQVIGINTAIAGNAQNIGFAIPINDVIGLVKQVETSGKLQQPYLGVFYIPITDDIAQQYSLRVNRGAWIPPVGVAGQDPILADGPAAKAGLQSGDIITQIDGTTIDQTNSLTALIDKRQVGQSVDLTVVRDGTTRHVKATLAAAPADNS